MKYIPLLDSLLFAGSRALALSVAAAATVMSTANAATYTEISDAGDIPDGAQITPLIPGDETLTEIHGDFEAGSRKDEFGNDVAFTADQDVDMYLIYISKPSEFSALTVSTGGGDPQLFLFNAVVQPGGFTYSYGVAANDDDGSDLDGNSPIEALLPVGNPLLTVLTPDYYYLAIGGFNHEPLAAPNDPSSPFAGFIFEQSSTGVQGPALGDTVAGFSSPAGGKNPIAGWSIAPGINTNAGPFSYKIILTGAEGAECPTCNQVPDSGTTLSLLGLSLGGLFLGTRKLKAKV